ncbi:MAG TPA: SGNH/GDSL hydrolase family protein [Anaeromyxobacter sp.]|nr:SGNH/GDSL hydrolase family protein [Anaeromyxobacter sp.]
MKISPSVHPLARLLALTCALGAAAPARAAGEAVYVSLGDVTPPGARAGDSARIVERLGTAGTRVRRVELTAPGMRADQVRQGPLGQAVSLRPKIVTLSIGAADACGTTELRTFARDLHVVTELLRRNSGLVVLSTMAIPEGPCSRAGPALRRRVEAFNAVIARAAAQNGVHLAELREVREAQADEDDASSPWEIAVAAELEHALAAARAAQARPGSRG